MKNRSVFSLLIVAAMMLAALTPSMAATRLQQKDVDPNDIRVSEVRLDMPIEPPSDLWTSYETVSAKNALGESAFNVVDGKFAVFALDLGRMDAVLANVPAEFSTLEKRENYQVTLPMPDGTLQRFRVWDSPIMEAPLAAEYPDVHTYVGQGVEDPTATVRFDRTPLGFHAMIISAGQTVYVDPYAAGDIQNYISYDKRGLRRDSATMPCLVDDAMQALDRDGGLVRGGDDSRVSAFSFGGTLRTYRLAQACTGEYATAVCTNNGVAVTVANTMSQITTTINRVTGIYERELSVRLVLVANTSSLVYTNASTDPYTNTNASSLLSQNTTTCNSVIGSANFDIGHVFSTGGGGLAGLGVVCGTRKAEGETGNSDPRGDGFDVDYVAHEMGHQFGGNHTFIGTLGSCSGNGNASTAYELGSGSTIQAYAGICSTQDLQPHSDDYFHTVSLNEMSAYITGGGACSSNAANGNTIPTLPALTSYTNVPVSTTFTLTAPTATDPNGDTLTYAWEDYNTGTACRFRPKAPTTSPSRTFGNVANPTSGNIAWETLPTAASTKTFRCTVRDNRAGGGAYTSSSMTVAFVAGAFSVSAPNTAVSWAGNSSQTVTWTKGGSVSPNVAIELSTNGGSTWSTVLASTANDGSEAITVPNTPSTTCRIRVRSTSNVYFDDSNVNFTITAGTGCTYSISPTSATAVAGGTTGTVSVTAGAGCAWTATSNAAWLTITSGASGSGNGTVGYSVAANTGSARSGTLTVAGSTFTVNQDAAASCSYSISPTSASPAAAATTGTVSVTAGTGCAWTATSNAAWLTITSGASGSGNGSVGYSVAANTGAARSGTLTIAGSTFTVNQAAGTTGGATPIACGATASGSLATTDVRSYVRGTTYYADIYSFTPSASGSATITMNSTFDTYLYLKSTETGTTALAFDDDGNGGTNSKIVYSVTAGTTYYIEATSYAANTTGSYTLTLACPTSVTTVLSEGAESGAAGWTVSTNTTGNNWVISAAGLATGANGFRSNQASATYPNNLDQSLISPAFSLAGKTSATLAFKAKQQTESSYDFFRVEVSTNGGSTWTSLSSVSTTSTGFTMTNGSGMVARTISLTPYVGQANVKIRFRLTSDASVQYWGVALDDIAVTAN
jgi:hypothetical protein